MKDLFSFQKKIALFLVVSISFLMGIGIDLYVPSLPDISSYYHSPIRDVELSISLYLLGYGLGQTILGIISDSYGRKKVFIFSSLLFSMTSILCAFSSNIYQLNIFRFIQGLAIAGLASGMRAIIVDLFEGLELKKMANYFALSWALGPIIAPFIGANLSDYFGWKSNFYLLSVYGFLVFIVCFLFFRESNKKQIKFDIKTIKSNFIEIITNKKFTLISIMYGLSYSSVLIFNTVGPDLIEMKFKYSIVDYGYLAMFLGCAYFLGTIINRYLIVKFNNENILKSGVVLAVLASFSMLLLTFEYQNVFVIILPIFLMFVFIGLIVPNAIAITMTIFPKKAGFATSLCGTIVGLIVFVVTTICGQFDISEISLSLCYICVFSILYIIKSIVFKRK